MGVGFPWLAWELLADAVSPGENLADPGLPFDYAMIDVTFGKGPSSVAFSSFLILPLTSSLSFNCWAFFSNGSEVYGTRTLLSSAGIPGLMAQSKS